MITAMPKLEKVEDLEQVVMGDPVPVKLNVGTNGTISEFTGLAAYVHEGDYPTLFVQSGENIIRYVLGLHGKDRIKIEDGKLTEDLTGVLVPKTFSRTITPNSDNYDFYRNHLTRIGLWK